MEKGDINKGGKPSKRFEVFPPYRVHGLIQIPQPVVIMVI